MDILSQKERKAMDEGIKKIILENYPELKNE